MARKKLSRSGCVHAHRAAKPNCDFPDRNTKIIGVSEIVTLNRRRPGWSEDKEAIAQPFWAELDRALRGRAKFGLVEVPFDLRAVPQADLPNAIEGNHDALRALLSVAGKRIVADASKKPSRLEKLLTTPLFRLRVI